MVYLLCFKDAEGNKAKIAHSGHYLGSVEGNTIEDVERRVRDYHAKGRGARFTQVATDLGLTFEIVRTWDGGKREERRLKNQKQGPRLCPICNRR